MLGFTHNYIENEEDGKAYEEETNLIHVLKL